MPDFVSCPYCLRRVKVAASGKVSDHDPGKTGFMCPGSGRYVSRAAYEGRSIGSGLRSLVEEGP